MNVVLPDPFAPISATVWPSSRSKLTPFRRLRSIFVSEAKIAHLDDHAHPKARPNRNDQKPPRRSRNTASVS
jgi:hypothetical protein